MIKLIIYYIVFSCHIILWKGLTLADENKKCDDFDAGKQQCSSDEVCIKSVCLCKPGFMRQDLNCVKNNPLINSVPSPAPYDGAMNKPPDEHNSHVAAAIIIPIMLILVVIGTVLLVRKYDVVSWVRTKLNQRQTPYDEVMIGQDDDDPPLTGV